MGQTDGPVGPAIAAHEAARIAAGYFALDEASREIGEILRWHAPAVDTLRKQMMQAAGDGTLTVRHRHTKVPYRPEVVRDFYELVTREDVNEWLEKIRAPYRWEPRAPIGGHREGGTAGYIVLPAGTPWVLFEEVPGLFARALYPPKRGESLGPAVRRADAEDLHRKALRDAADAGELPLCDHAGLPTMTSPRARVKLDALRQYAAKFDIAVTLAHAGSGFRQGNAGPRQPAPWPAADWELWAFMPKATVREAVLLSVGLDPRPTRTTQAGHAPPEMLEPGPEFQRRLTLACAHVAAEGPLRAVMPMQLLGAREAVEVSLPEFRTWAEGMGWPLPELFPQAEKALPNAKRATAAQDALASPLDVGGDWKERARDTARAIIKREAARDLYPPQGRIADEVAADLRRRGVFGADGKPLTGATIKRHALRGISSAKKKALSTAPKRGK